MASNAATIRIGADEGYLAQSIGKGISQGLGRASGDLRSFDAQLERANRRVIAFGTSATLVYGTVRAFRELLDATVDVEKSLTSLNAIFDLNSRQLDVFGKKLFDVARETSEGFKETASAAEEFSRQGLGAVETLKRTRDAMILVRLTGLDVSKSVEALTASVNIFGRAGLNTTDILNKLVAVDQKFAVSTRDLAESFSRVGNVATDAGVDIDKFIGLITAAQQITARGGPVIANAIKTIFTRLDRGNTLDQLESLGVVVRKINGEMLDQYTVLENVAKAYKNLTKEQQNQVAELGGGVFQINQFKALLYDLGKANGIAAQATRTSSDAINEAVVRNAALNQTLASSLQNLKTSATQAAAVIGNLSLKGGLQNLVGGGNLLTGLFSKLSSNGDTKAAEDFGAYVGESILNGIGNVISGPGLVILGRLLYGAIKRTFPEVIGDLKSTIGTTGTGQNTSLELTNQLLSQATTQERARYAAATAVAEQEAIILGILERQVAIMGGAGLVGRPIRPARAAEGYIPGAAGGYIPGALSAERAAISMGVGGAPVNARPVLLPSFNFGGGRVGPLVANTSEFVVPHMAGGGMAVFSQDMIQHNGGIPAGAIPVAATGYVPNAAKGAPIPYPLGNTSYYGGDIEREAYMRQETAKLEQANAEFQARLLSQQEAIAKGEVELLQSEQIRIARLKATSYPITHYDSSPSDPAAFDARMAAHFAAQGPYDPSSGNTLTNATTSGTSRLAAELAAADRKRYTDEQARIRQETKDAKFGQYAGRVQQAGFLASFIPGFLPEAKGGTGSGQAIGALSGGLQGFGAGATIGSIFGPTGTVAGGAIGAIGGALVGFASKLTKSFSEIVAEIDKSNSKLKQEIENVSGAFALQDQIIEARAVGTSVPKIVGLQQQYNASLATITDPDVRALVLRGATDPDAREKASTILNERGRRRSSEDILTLAFKNPDSTLETKSQALNGVLGNLSDAQLAALGRVLDSAQHEYAHPSNRAGKPFSFQGSFSSVLGSKVGSFLGRDEVDTVGTSLSSILELRRLEAAEAQRVANLPEGQRPVLTPERLALSKGYEFQSQLKGIRGGAALSILQARQQVALSNPGLDDVARLALSGQQAGTNIEQQFKTQQGVELNAGRRQLVDSLGKSGGRGLFQAIDSQTGLESLLALKAQLNPQQTGGIPSSLAGATPEFRKALEELIEKMTILNLTGETNIKVNTETNAIQARLLRYNESRGGAQANLAEASRLEAIKQFRANRAVLDNRGSEFISGSQVESAGIGIATQEGQLGDSLSSFTKGFSSRFAGLQQDFKQFAQVGQQVANSLENSLGNAFGDFVTGAARGKDAFRSFVTSVLSDSARAFASKAVQQLLGTLIGSFLSPGGGIPDVRAGTPYALGSTPTFLSGAAPTFADGGMVPSLLTGGEFVFTPSQVRALGPSTVKAINSGAARRFDAGGLVRGGSGMRDDVFSRLAAGSYVIKRPMVDRYGAGNLSALAGATATISGTPVGDQSPVSAMNAAASGSVVATPVPLTPASGGSNTNVTVGVTINNNGSASTTTRTGGDGSQGDRQFGDKLAQNVRQVVLQTLAEQSRVGGMVRKQSLANT